MIKTMKKKQKQKQKKANTDPKDNNDHWPFGHLSFSLELFC